MKYFIIVFLSTFVFSSKGFSQEKNTTHKVEKGETIGQIAQKYKVTPYDIYKLNPDAQSGLKPNSVLLIPKKASAVAVIPAKPNSQVKTHKVEPKETLFGIENKYGVTDEALKKSQSRFRKVRFTNRTNPCYSFEYCFKNSDFNSRKSGLSRSSS